MNSDEMRSWRPTKPPEPRGTLPDLGNGIHRNGLVEALRRLNEQFDTGFGNTSPVDPMLNGILSQLPSLRNSMNDGRLKFHAEIPGLSNRFFLGFRYNF